MTQTMSVAGTPLYFPASLATGADGVIVPMPLEGLVDLACQVAPDGALLFAKRLIGAARKYHREPRYAAINHQRVQLARLCLERALGDVPDVVTELRAARVTIAAERAGLVADNGGVEHLDPDVVPFVDRLDRQLARIDAALAVERREPFETVADIGQRNGLRATSVDPHGPAIDEPNRGFNQWK